MKDPEVTVYDWPYSFHVEAETKDRDYEMFFPHDTDDPPPHFVDLSEPFCSCRDFHKNILPNLVNENSRMLCIHMIAAIKYLKCHKQPLKKLPRQFNLALNNSSTF